MTQTNALAINIEQLRFRWPNQTNDLLNIPSLQVAYGEHLFIQGSSGSGKSTLLNLMAGVLSPHEGKIELLGQNLNSLSNGQKDRFRSDHLGIIFQQFNLLPYLNGVQNIELALNISKKRIQREQLATANKNAVEERIFSLLDALGLHAKTAMQTANQLSIGQQQRIAVARALIGCPEILIADEPTSALDSDTRDRFIEQLFHAAEKSQTTVVFVSHDQQLKSHFHRQIKLADYNQACNSVEMGAQR